jgi:hypothetical protein
MRFVILILIVFATSTLPAQEKKRWTSPDYLTFQFAGSIGYLSGGIGYDIFKNKARTSFHFGHVPKSVGGPLNIFAGKLMFVPRSYKLSERSTLNPFDAGIMVSYHLGDDFRSTWPEHRYPEHYYWWQTSFRLHLNLESSLTVKLKEHTTFKSVTGYVEFNTNDLYMVSIFQNHHALTLLDIVKLGAGARFHF